MAKKVSNRTVVKEASDLPDQPVDKALFDEKPRAEWKGRDGSKDWKVEKAVMKRDKTDRKKAKKEAIAIKGARKNQMERKRFVNPVTNADVINKLGTISRADSLRQRAQKKGLIKLTKKTIEGNGQSNVILVVRNRHPPGSKVSVNVMKDLGIHYPYSAVLIPNTLENCRKIQGIKKFCFYGCVSPAVLKETITKRGSIWTNPDDVHHVNKEDKVTLNDNTEIEKQLGYLDILSIDDLSFALLEADAEVLPKVLAHLAPLKLSEYPKARTERLDTTEAGLKGILVTEAMDEIIKVLI